MIAALVRHGVYEQPERVPSAHLPHGLTPEGREQAVGAARDVLLFSDDSELRVDSTVHTSSLRRAWETAEVIAREMGRLRDSKYELQEDHDLAERSVGAAANMTVDEIAEVVAADPRYDELPEGWKSDSRFRLPLPGAESLLKAGVRTAEVIEERVDAVERRASEDTLTLFVGHGAAFRHAAAVMGVLDLEEVAGLSMFHCRPVYLERSARGRWKQVGGQWKVRRSGERPD